MDDTDLRIAVYELQQRVAALEARLGAGADGAAAAPPPASPLDDPELQQLIRDGRTIDAIKLFRAKTGLGLAEAKYAIDNAPRV